MNGLIETLCIDAASGGTRCPAALRQAARARRQRPEEPPPRPRRRAGMPQRHPPARRVPHTMALILVDQLDVAAARQCAPAPLGRGRPLSAAGAAGAIGRLTLASAALSRRCGEPSQRCFPRTSVAFIVLSCGRRLFSGSPSASLSLAPAAPPLTPSSPVLAYVGSLAPRSPLSPSPLISNRHVVRGAVQDCEGGGQGDRLRAPQEVVVWQAQDLLARHRRVRHARACATRMLPSIGSLINARIVWMRERARRVAGNAPPAPHSSAPARAPFSVLFPPSHSLQAHGLLRRLARLDREQGRRDKDGLWCARPAAHRHGDPDARLRGLVARDAPAGAPLRRLLRRPPPHL
jgi:hypothetical protein